MHKRGKKLVLTSLFEIVLLVLMSIAVSFIVSENMEIVSANGLSAPPDLTPGTLADARDKTPVETIMNAKIGAESPPTPIAPAPLSIPGDAPSSPPTAPTPTQATSSQILTQARNAKQIQSLLKEKAKLEKDLKEYEKNIKKFSGLSDENINLKFFKDGYDKTSKGLETTNKKLKDAGYGSSAAAEAAGKAAPLKIFGGIWDVENTPGANLLAGVAYAGAVYGALGFVTDMIGLKESGKQSLRYSVASGVMAYQIIKAYQSWDKAPTTGQGFLGLGKEGIIGKHPGMIGVGVAALVFVLTYKETSKGIYELTCPVWQPPIGGRYCEECNKDPFRPCSEYRCKSLGQACELLNKGSADEKCVWVNPGDVNSPIITPWKNALSPDELQFTNHQTRPPSRGTKIIHTKTTDKCLPAFTKLQFGITTNEPAQCKIDLQIKAFEEMQYFIGGSNFFLLNHTEIFRLPAPEANTTDYAPILQPDGTFTYFIKCMDANGNKNDDDFAISFCVDESPDTTPPLIENSSILSGSPVTSGIDNLTIEVYVNEPAQCKWSIADKGYDDMEHELTCATQANQINAELTYTCSSLLTGIINQQQNKFYFRCKDKPASPENERNVMAQSFELNLLGTQGLNIIDTSPNETIKGASLTIKLDLELETDDGAEQGRALCMFSGTGLQGSYIPMFETNSHLHKQTLELGSGAYKYYFLCIDAGGNSANASTTFSVETDKTAPLVVRTYKEQPDALKVVTNEDAKCTYSLTSCNFVLTDGQVMLNSPPSDKTNHYAKWEAGKIYYVKCMDEFGNEPSPNGCSMIAGATEI